MEFNKIEFEVVTKTALDAGVDQVVELSELHLLLVGGGVGEVVMA